MTLFYNPDKKEFHDIERDSEVPSYWVEIEPSALEYYNKNAEYYNIKLDIIQGPISIAKIKELGVNEEFLRNVRLREINSKCKEYIHNGLDIETSRGIKHFSLKDEDHREILELLYLDQEEYEYHADGEAYLFWNRSDFHKITSALLSHKNYHRKYCNILRSKIQTMKLEELWDVTYLG